MELELLSKYDDVLTLKDLMTVLKISKSKAYRLLQAGIIPSRKLGAEYRILKIDLIEFLRN